MSVEIKVNIEVKVNVALVISAITGLVLAVAMICNHAVPLLHDLGQIEYYLANQSFDQT